MRISRSEQYLFLGHLLCQEESLANNNKTSHVTPRRPPENITIQPYGSGHVHHTADYMHHKSHCETVCVRDQMV